MDPTCVGGCFTVLDPPTPRTLVLQCGHLICYTCAKTRIEAAARNSRRPRCPYEFCQGTGPNEENVPFAWRDVLVLLRAEMGLQRLARLLAAVYNEQLPADVQPGPAYDVDGLYVNAAATAASGSRTGANRPASPPGAPPQDRAGGAAGAGDPPAPAAGVVDLDALRAHLPPEYHELDESTLRAIAAAMVD